MKVVGRNMVDVSYPPMEVLAESESFQLTGGKLRDDNDCTVATLLCTGRWRSLDGKTWSDITIEPDES